MPSATSSAPRTATDRLTPLDRSPAHRVCIVAVLGTLTRSTAADSDSSATCQRPAAASQHHPAGAANTRYDSAEQWRTPMSERTAFGSSTGQPLPAAAPSERDQR